MNSDWHPIKIGDLGRIITGKTPPSSRPECFGSDYPFITPSDIESDARRVETERYLSMIGQASMPNYLLPEKSICVVCIGATIGKICMTHTKSFTNQQVNSIITDTKRFDPHFVYYMMKKIGPSLLGIASGAATPIINKSSFSAVEIVAPVLPTQRRIASILSAYDDLIENNTRRIAILEEMARRIYEEWFVHFRFPGHEQVKMVESELGLIPEGWSLCRLDELYKTASGGTPSRQRSEYFGGNIRWVKTQELQDSWIFETSEKITESGLANSSAKIFPAGAILVAMYGATIGQLGILGVAAATNQACCAVIPYLETFGTIYAYLTLQVRRQELIDLRAGAAQQNINQLVVRQFPMLVPSDHSLLHRFTATVTPLLELSSVLQRTNANLRATRDLLLPKLISGELDVSSLPEPEEVITA